MTGYHPDYADHAQVLARHRGLGHAATLHKPFGVQELTAALETT
jgi:hypothetical protein